MKKRLGWSLLWMFSFYALSFIWTFVNYFLLSDKNINAVAQFLTSCFEKTFLLRPLYISEGMLGSVFAMIFIQILLLLSVLFLYFKNKSIREKRWCRIVTPVFHCVNFAALICVWLGINHFPQLFSRLEPLRFLFLCYPFMLINIFLLIADGMMAVFRTVKKPVPAENKTRL